MAVAVKVDFLWFPIGTGDFVHCFLSTICVNLENRTWGSRFPFLMNDLYQGELSYVDVDSARLELDEVLQEFGDYPPDKVIWDSEEVSKKPPWGDVISSDIHSLSNYIAGLSSTTI
jgi:hypothetical protein